jgi:hypothetical protein
MQRFVELTTTLLNNIAQRFVRNNSMTASNFFQAVNYHPDESQILTTGTDRKVIILSVYLPKALNTNRVIK